MKENEKASKEECVQFLYYIVGSYLGTFSHLCIVDCVLYIGLSGSAVKTNPPNEGCGTLTGLTAFPMTHPFLVHAVSRVGSQLLTLWCSRDGVVHLSAGKLCNVI